MKKGISTSTDLLVDKYVFSFRRNLIWNLEPELEVMGPDIL